MKDLPPLGESPAPVDAAPVDAAAALPRAYEPPDRASFGDVPAQPASGSFAAPGPADWPCAARERHASDDEWQVTLRFVYGKRRACRLVIGVVDQSLTGCPERSVATRDGKFYDIQRFEYDEAGRLTLLDSNFGPVTFTWQGEVPETDGPRRTASPGRLEYTLIDRQVVDVDALGRPLRLWTIEHGALASRCELVWSGARLDHRQCYDEQDRPTWRYEPIYDCKALPRLGPSVNPRGPLGM